MSCKDNGVVSRDISVLQKVRWGCETLETVKDEKDDENVTTV